MAGPFGPRAERTKILDSKFSYSDQRLRVCFPIYCRFGRCDARMASRPQSWISQPCCSVRLYWALVSTNHDGSTIRFRSSCRGGSMTIHGDCDDGALGARGGLVVITGDNHGSAIYGDLRPFGGPVWRCHGRFGVRSRRRPVASAFPPVRRCCRRCTPAGQRLAWKRPA